MTTVLLGAGLGVLALAGLTDVVFGVRGAAARLAPHLLCAVAAVPLLVAGWRAANGAAGRLDLSGWAGFGPAGLGLDPLSGLFLCVAAAVAVPVALVFASWSRSTERLRRRGLGALHALTLAAVVVIMTADNAFVFLFGWEGLTVLFYLLTGFARHRPGRARASILTVGMSKAGGGALLIGLLLLAARAHSFRLADFATVPGGGVRAAAYALLLLAFAVKVGLVPVQSWMPSGYAAAPGPARALMAGVAALVGFYGMWRTLGLLGAPPAWLVVVVLLLGGVTALLGIAHTTVQQDLRKTIAYSSVENAGLIVTGFGVGLVGAATHLPALEAAGLLAAMLQAIAHAVAKSALFSATATFEVAEGTTSLDRLMGLGRRMPFSGIAFGVGALTLAGLPPTAGFVSEWFLLEALMQQFRLTGLVYRLPLAAAGALVALTAGFAAVAFVRVLGLVVLGAPDRDRVQRREAGLAARAGMLALAAGCLALAALSPLEIGLVASGLRPLVPAGTTLGASGPGWVLGPVYQDFSVLSPSWLAIELPIAVAAVLLFAWAISAGRLFTVRRVAAWRSAGGGVRGRNSYTPFAYANPTRRVLASVLLTKSRTQDLEQKQRPEASVELDPVRQDEPSARLGHTVDVVEIVDRYGYRLLSVPLRALSAAALRLQSGRLGTYLGYMLIALIALLAVVTAMR